MSAAGPEKAVRLGPRDAFLLCAGRHGFTDSGGAKQLWWPGGPADGASRRAEPVARFDCRHG